MGSTQFLPLTYLGTFFWWQTHLSPFLGFHCRENWKKKSLEAGSTHTFRKEETHINPIIISQSPHLSIVHIQSSNGYLQGHRKTFEGLPMERKHK